MHSVAYGGNGQKKALVAVRPTVRTVLIILTVVPTNLRNKIKPIEKRLQKENLINERNCLFKEAVPYFFFRFVINAYAYFYKQDRPKSRLTP